MESPEDGRESAVEETQPVQRQLPPGGHKIERMANETKALVQDMTDWVELKMKLTQLEIEQKIDERVNRIALNVIVGVAGALGGVFALVTLALALGAWLGHPAWGFLIVTVLLFAVAGIMQAAKPNLVKRKPKQAAIDEKKRAADRTRPAA